MRRARIFGIMALIPVALNLAAPAQARMLSMPVCTGDGAVRMIELPADPANPDTQERACCVKGCHTGASRKRTGCHA